LNFIDDPAWLALMFYRPSIRTEQKSL